jgi:putative ABC transport system permease protein
MQDVRLEAWVLLGAVLAVLLIARANVASLLMARGAMRQRELAIRSALGASRARLASQALTEALLLSLTGAVGGCILAEGLLHIFIAIAPASIPYLGKAQLDMRIICFTVLLSILCGVLFGLASALQKPAPQMLTGRSHASVSHATLRQWLVVAQIAASMVLLAGASLLLRSFWNLQNQHLGMRTDNTLTVSISLGEHNYPTTASTMSFFQRLQHRLQFGPGVSIVAVSDSLPPASNHNGGRYDSIVVSGRPPSTGGTGGLVTSRMVSPDYFHALDIPIVQGESFSGEQVTSSERFAILSQKLADRLFPGKSPVGERVQFENYDGRTDAPWFTIVGVAANVKNGGLTGEEVPEYDKLRRDRSDDWDGHGVWGRTSVIVVRTSLPPEQMSPWIRSQVATLDPTLPVDIATLQQRVSKLADQPRFQTLLVGFFAATGLLLAVLGLYGVISFLVTQRTQEIGVRMALGANRLDILRLIAWNGMRLIMLGGILGLFAALGLTQVLKSLLFSIGPHDPVTFLGVMLLLAVVALVAILIPAREAMKVEPVVALRYE